LGSCEPLAGKGTSFSEPYTQTAFGRDLGSFGPHDEAHPPPDLNLFLRPYSTLRLRTDSLALQLLLLVLLLLLLLLFYYNYYLYYYVHILLIALSCEDPIYKQVKK